MTKHHVYTMGVVSVYHHYVTKAKKKDIRKQKSLSYRREKRGNNN